MTLQPLRLARATVNGGRIATRSFQAFHAAARAPLGSPGCCEKIRFKEKYL